MAAGARRLGLSRAFRLGRCSMPAAARSAAAAERGSRAGGGLAEAGGVVGTGSMQTEPFISDTGSLRVRWETRGETAAGRRTISSRGSQRRQRPLARRRRGRIGRRRRHRLLQRRSAPFFPRRGVGKHRMDARRRGAARRRRSTPSAHSLERVAGRRILLAWLYLSRSVTGIPAIVKEG